MTERSPEHLLRHGPFLQLIARALLRDTHEAEDVVQDAYTAALTQPPPARWPLSQWLAGVTRNLARRRIRDRARRRARERAAGRRESGRSTAEVVELEELRGRVVAAVLGLDEPYRTVVLLRFYDGLAPREIAARVGTPAATVRSQLHRAVTRLRGILDAQQREDTPRWTALLAGIAWPARRATVTVAAPWAAALCLLALAAYAVHALAATSEGVEAVRPAAGAPEEIMGDTSSPARPAAARSPLATTPPRPAALTLRFVAADGHVVAGSGLEALFRRHATRPTVTVLDEDHARHREFDLDLWQSQFSRDPDTWMRTRSFDPAAAPLVLDELPRYDAARVVVARPGASPFVSPRLSLPLTAPRTLDVPLPAAASYQRFRFSIPQSDEVVEHATVNIFFGMGLHAYVPGTTVEVGDGGLCRLALERPADGGISCWVEAEEHAIGFHRLGTSDAVQEVWLAGRCTVRATVFRDDGLPAANTRVALLSGGRPCVHARTDSEGRLQVDGLVPGSLTICVPDPRRAYALVHDGTIDPGETELVIGAPRRGARLSGRITAGGAPVVGALVTAETGDTQRYVRTDGGGNFDLTGLGTSVQVVARAGFLIRSETPVALPRGGVRTLDFALPDGCLTLRVSSEADGRPLPGVWLRAQPRTASLGQGRFPGYEYRPGSLGRTDADGCVVLRGLFRNERHRVSVRMTPTSFRTIADLTPGADRGPIELRIDPRLAGR